MRILAESLVIGNICNNVCILNDCGISSRIVILAY